MILQGSSTISMSMRAYGNTAPTFVHVYANVDYDIVWDVVNEEAPKLKQTLLKNDDIRREYESTLVVEEDIEEDILGYFGALDPIVGDGADGRIPQDGNRP